MKDMLNTSKSYPFKASLCLLTSMMFTGCSSDDTDSSDGYVLFYNASDNAPELVVSLEADDTIEFSGIDASESSGIQTISADEYTLEVSLSTEVNSDSTLFKQSQSIRSDDVSLIVVTGDIKSPELLTFNYELEDPENDDGLFTLRFMNLDQSEGGLDIYMAADDENFEESVFIDSLSYANLSISRYFDVDDYKFYLTKAGSSEVIFESDPIAFYYTTQQVIVVKKDGLEEDSGYVIEKLSSTGSASRYQHVNNSSSFKIYNAMDRNTLQPNYEDHFDFYLGQITETPTIDNLSRYQMSDSITVDQGDFTMNITTDEQQGIAGTHVLSLPANSNKTVFYYHTEIEEEDDEDDSTNEETELFVNTLVVDNNTTTDVYQHEVKIINFVEDYSSLTVYFVEAGETLSSTSHKSFNSRAVPSTQQLYNGSYHVYVMALEDDTEVLIADTEIQIDEDFGHQFLLIEQEDKNIQNFNLQFVSQ